MLVETGRGYFHTEVGKLQAEIDARVRAGVIKTESELIEATREAYRLAAKRTGVTVNEQALDRAIVSNLATLSETAAQTRSELSLPAGATTVTEQSLRLPKRPQPTACPCRQTRADDCRVGRRGSRRLGGNQDSSSSRCSGRGGATRCGSCSSANRRRWCSGARTLRHERPLGPRRRRPKC